MSFKGTEFLTECVNNIYVIYDLPLLSQAGQEFDPTDATSTGVPAVVGAEGFFADGTYISSSTSGTPSDGTLTWNSYAPAFLKF